LADGALLGVFEMGSMAAEEFTEHDILLFGTVATLLQQRLGKEAEQKRGETHVGFASCDITNRKQAEQFVRHVITIVAHDISSPLTAIALCVPLLEGAGIPERITKAAGIIGQSSSQIGRILVDLHEYVGAIVQAPLVVERRLTDLCAVARAVLDDARVAHPERQFRLEGEQATWGNWDGPRLTRALANLVGNAVKYSAKGTPVVVRVSGRDDAGVVDVENVGCSIAQTLLPHIFEPFRDGRLQLGRPGMGLGLFLAREIARAHHGDLEVHSDAGKVVFRMVLHRKPEASD
jgi:signal transduction histidine kinase